jgi:Notch-like protein
MRMLIFGVLLAAVPGLMVEAEVQVERSAWDALVGSAKDTVGGHVGRATAAVGSALDESGMREGVGRAAAAVGSALDESGMRGGVYGAAGTAAHAAGAAARSTRRLASDSLDRVKPLVAGGLATAGEIVEGTVDHLSAAATDATARAASTLLNGARSVVWTAVCGSNPCQNGGECVISAASDQQYTCLCPTSYVGSNCERNTGCDSQPCLNGGTCGLTAPGAESVGYLCKCTSGFNGGNCEVSGTPHDESSGRNTTGLVALIQYAARCAVLLGLLALGYLVARGQAAGPDTEKAHDTDTATLQARSTTGGDQPPASTDSSQTGVGDEGWVEVESNETK